MSKMLFLYVSLCCLVGCFGFKTGPPADSCGSMFPTGHGAAAQTTTPPYTLTVNATSYDKASGVIEVTLTATERVEKFFEGFFVQARRADCSQPTTAIGNFSLAAADPEMKAMKCSGSNGANNAVAHTSSSHKVKKIFLWSNTAGEDVYFTATVVNHKETFWTELNSAYVYDAAKTPQATHVPCSTVSTVSTVSTTVNPNSASTVGLSAWLTSGIIMLLFLQ